MEVSAQRMREIANELKDAAARMEENLTHIKEMMEKVGEADIWAGTAANNSREEFDRLSAYFPSFSEAVLDCSKGLEQLAANYDNAEAKISAQISG